MTFFRNVTWSKMRPACISYRYLQLLVHRQQVFPSSRLFSSYQLSYLKKFTEYEPKGQEIPHERALSLSLDLGRGGGVIFLLTANVLTYKLKEFYFT